MRTLVTLGLSLSALALEGASAQDVAAYPADFTLAIATGGEARCVSADALEGPMRPYVRHLQDRLEIPLQACAYSSDADVAAALAAGEADFGYVAREAFAAIDGAVVPILRHRPEGAPPRSEFVVAAPTAAGLTGAAAAAGLRLLAAGELSMMLEAPRQALAAHAGVDPDAISVTSAGSVMGAFAALGAGEGDALLMPISFYSAACGAAEEACAALSVIWRAFPPVDEAWVLRADAPAELRYRLIGIHVPMHLEAREAFDAVVPPRTMEFEPVEPTALRLHDTAG